MICGLLAAIAHGFKGRGGKVERRNTVDGLPGHPNAPLTRTAKPNKKLSNGFLGLIG